MKLHNIVYHPIHDMQIETFIFIHLKNNLSEVNCKYIGANIVV